MAPETIVGQLRMSMTEKHIASRIESGATFAGAWEGMFGTLEYKAVMDMDVGTEITIDWELGGDDTLSAADVWRLIFDSNKPWILTANGTILTHEKKGVVPGLLERWYTERQEIQAKMRTCEGEERAFWDKRQLVKKINLNSLYGAILNPGCRFFDHRIGQSTTLTGRAIAKHMSAKVNELLTGEYDHTGDCIVYGDTDSVYFSAWPVIKDDVSSGKMDWGKEQCIQLYDQLGEAVNETFPSFMETAFHTTRKHGEIMAGAREVVALKGLFITKKRYAALVIDNEGQRFDIDGKLGKMKAMGLDLKRSDTPLVMQEFMSSLLLDVLTGSEVDHVVTRIKDFKYQFKDQPGWEKGTPKRVNNLTMYTAKEWATDKKGVDTWKGKANMPGHVRAAINWNRLKKMHGDNYSQSIIDGMKTIVCKLKPNPLGYTSVGYPTDESHLPQWFKDLPFDDSLMEATIVDKKIDNLLGVLEWDLAGKTQTENQFDDLFSFG